MASLSAGAYLGKACLVNDLFSELPCNEQQFLKQRSANMSLFMFEGQELSQVNLAGYSSGCLAVSTAADRVSGREALIFLDAAIVEDRENLCDAFPPPQLKA
jgi:hypothetical protein